MADDRSQGARGSWRAGAERERPEAGASTGYRWNLRGGRPGGVDHGARSRLARMIAGLLAFAACLGVVVWLIWMINPPRPAAVVLVGADYADNLAVPHNVLGVRGLGGIERLARAPRRWALFNPASIRLVRGPGNRAAIETADDWDGLIAELKKGGAHEPTLMIVLALHGGSGPEGAYLMPGRMKRPEDRLGMNKVIASMKELPAEQAKILVIEGAQVDSDERLGMIHNDFPRRLKDLEPEIRRVDNLWVLAGCDVDQRCWGSEGLGRTAFGYYIAEALRGREAAGSDGRLSLDELYHYVRENVRRWAWAARGAVQEPVLLPSTAGRSSRQPSSVYLATVEAAAPADAPPPPDREALAAARLRARRLEAQLPHPSTYSPLRWRAYGAALARHEQLLLAGDAEAARAVGDRLSRLEQAIRKDRASVTAGSSAGISLAMDALVGAVAPSADPPGFLKIAQAGDEPAARKLWDAIAANEGLSGADDDSGPARPLRDRLAEYLLRRAQDDPGADLSRAADRIRLVGFAGEPLPAGAHFLRMLRAGLSPPLERRPPGFARLAARALRVRVLAERAAMGADRSSRGYPYSEQVHAWTGRLVEEADARRRLGEDRLFAADEPAWTQARQDLEAAESGYREAVSRAEAIRGALAVRDRAFAELPAYARWLARRPLEGAGDDLPRRAEDLWARAHRLSGMLRRMGDPPAIAALSRELDAGLADLAGRFFRENEAIARDRLREDWEAETAAMAVPFPDDEKLSRRSAIWDRLDRIRLHDLEVARSTSSAAGAERPPSDPGPAPSRRAAIRGALALSALGEAWFGRAEFKDEDQGDYEATLRRLRELPTRPEANGPWWEEAARQGDRIGRRVRALRPEVDALADEGRGVADFAAFRARLAEADALARMVERGEDPPAGTAPEPSSRRRQADAHDLLTWMAERAWRDHWYAENPSAPPYYLAVVERLLDDARGLFPALREADQRLRDRLTAPGRLVLEGPRRLVVTSELEAPAPYRVVDEAGPQLAPVPPGIPVVRPRVSGPLGLVGATAGFRTVERGPKAGARFRVASPALVVAERRAEGFEALLAGPDARRSALEVDGYFRGQAFSLATEVDLQVIPDAVDIGPAPPDPPRASVAVRASDAIIRRFGEGTGRVAVVLDCSGSMRFDGDGRKWPNAREALYRVLRDSVPRGTRLSLWTFSQLPADIQVDDKGDIARGVNAPEQIEYAQQLKAHPEQTILCQKPMAPWDPAQADEVATLLERTHPFFDTPLVEAMWRAASRDLLGGTGMKNLLVLTDGADTEFDKNTALNQGGRLKIPGFLAEQFRNRGIRVTVVYFRGAGPEVDEAGDGELRKARANFEAPLRGLEPPGQFIVARDLRELIAHLRAGLDQRVVCRILRPDRTAVGDETLDVTRPDGDLLRWWPPGLDPGRYTIRVHAGRTYDQDVQLRAGDRMIVELVDDATGEAIGFRRALYGDDRGFRDEPRRSGGGWRFTLLGARQAGERPAGVDLMAAVESTARAGEVLEQPRPGWVGFRLAVGGQPGPPAPVASRWRERLTFPGPVWRLDAPSWPADPADAGRPARPVLTAWWREGGPLPVDADFVLDPAGTPFDVPLPDGGAVTVEDIRIEEHYVESRPGEAPTRQPCLVARLAFPRGRPYFIDPASLEAVRPAGHEHRFYERASKYAGLFWPVTDDQFEALRKGRFRLISVDRLRGEAEKQGRKAELELERPREDVRLPEPPLAITGS